MHARPRSWSQTCNKTTTHARIIYGSIEFVFDSTMPGHSIHSAIFKDRDALNRYLCPKCNKLLSDPVQPSCGHRMCKSCVEEMLAQGRGGPPLCPSVDCGEAFEKEDGAYVSWIAGQAHVYRRAAGWHRSAGPWQSPRWPMDGPETDRTPTIGYRPAYQPRARRGLENISYIVYWSWRAISNPRAKPWNWRACADFHSNIRVSWPAQRV